MKSPRLKKITNIFYDCYGDVGDKEDEIEQIIKEVCWEGWKEANEQQHLESDLRGWFEDWWEGK